MTNSSRIATILLWVLLVISAILVVSLMVNISENLADPQMAGWINTNLYWTYILLFVGAGVAVVGGLIQMFSDIRSAKRAFVSLAILAAVVLVSYLLASDTMPTFIGIQRFVDAGLTAQTVKLIVTGLIITYILLGLAVLAILLAPVRRLFD